MGNLYKESYANMYAALNVRNALDKLINTLQSPRGGRLETRRRNSSSTTSTKPTPQRDYTNESAKCHALVTCLTKPASASSAAHRFATPPTIKATPKKKKKPILVSEPASPPDIKPSKVNLTTRLVAEPASQAPVIPAKFDLTTRLVSEPSSPPVVPSPKFNLTSRLEPAKPPETPYSTAAAPIICGPVIECDTDSKTMISLPSRGGNKSSNCAQSVDSGLNPLRNPEQSLGFVTPPPLDSKLRSNPNLNLNLNPTCGGKRSSSLTSEFSELGAEDATHIPPHLHDDQVTALHLIN